MNDESFYAVPLDAFKDETFNNAVLEFPQGSIVYLKITKQLGEVEEVRPSADGPRIKVKFIGLVPVKELRPATEEEIASFSKEI